MHASAVASAHWYDTVGQLLRPVGTSAASTGDGSALDRLPVADAEQTLIATVAENPSRYADVESRVRDTWTTSLYVDDVGRLCTRILRSNLAELTGAGGRRLA